MSRPRPRLPRLAGHLPFLRNASSIIFGLGCSERAERNLFAPYLTDTLLQYGVTLLTLALSQSIPISGATHTILVLCV